MGRYLRDTLTGIAETTPRIGAVRGAGLYVAADFVEPGTGQPDGDAAIRVVNGLRERHVLISATGPDGSTLKIRPPLPFARPHVDQLADALSATLSASPHHLAAPRATPDTHARHIVDALESAPTRPPLPTRVSHYVNECGSTNGNDGNIGVVPAAAMLHRCR